jgi:amino acid transporter
MSVFIITGAFACAAALNNAGLRYTYALGREGLLPKALGRTHPKHRTPHVAVLVQALIAAAIVLAFRFADRAALDVYYWIAVQGVIWIILVQALTSLAVWTYFRRQPESERHWWKTTAAPWIGFLAQVLVLYLCYKYLSSLAAGDVLYVKELGQIGNWAGFEIDITWLGIIGVAVPVLALVYALILRSTNPARYETAGRFINEGDLT